MCYCMMEYFWPNAVMRKLLNISCKAQDFHADEIFQDHLIERRRSMSDRESLFSTKILTENLLNKPSENLKRVMVEPDLSQVTDILNLRVFVGTWNVGGKSPHNRLNLDEWLHASSQAADIYVLGFQEIVPLNAGNILGAEDNGPAAKWITLIRQTLNKSRSPCNGFSPGSWDESRDASEALYSNDSDIESPKGHENSVPLRTKSFQISNFFFKPKAEVKTHPLKLKRKSSLADHFALESQSNIVDASASFRSFASEEESSSSVGDSPCTVFQSPLSSSSLSEKSNSSQPNYCLAARKQMVGIFLCVWVRSDLRQHIRDLKVSCVGRGLMGYLGNKGSISISMLLHQTSFCFVCTHLTSGEKGGDERKRNSDVTGILKKTRFPQVRNCMAETNPESILDHDRVIWLGDLNYRLALRSTDSKKLVENNDWETMLEKDQLLIGQKAGRIFKGWNEGKIYFPPTYKYCRNSDHYAGQNLKSRAKRRRPAWCDRILWYGKGLRQLSYVRGESKFSDHRPVYSDFVAEVEVLNRSKLKRALMSSGARLQVKELPRTNSYH